MNIVFLDIDGVLNDSTYLWSESHKQKRKTQHDDIDESKLSILQRIVNDNDAKIVLSSTWRVLDDDEDGVCSSKYKYLTDMLSKYGMTIFDKTPVIFQNRPLEIKTWLDARADNDDIKYISLDDDFDYSHYNEYGIENCLVKTTFYCRDGESGGINEEHIENAKKIFAKQGE